MAAKTAILSVRVISDTKKAQQGAQDTASAWEKAQSRINKLAGIAAGVGAGVVALGKKAVDAASNLEQSTGGVETVFKKYASEITSYAETAWKSVGLSQSETQEMATILGSQLKNLGIPMEDVAGKTIDLVKLGADLAATYGGTTSEAVESLSSLLRGERDPIEKYGVSIKQADIEAEKMALGLTGLTGEAAKQAEIQATLSLLTKQTADAQGMAAKEAGTYASVQQKLGAVWENTAAQLGTALLPVVTKATQLLADLGEWAGKNEKLVMNLAKAVMTAVGVLVGLAGAIKAVQIITTVAGGIRTAVTVTQSFIAGLTSARAAASAFTGVAGTLGGNLAALVKSMVAGTAAAAKWAAQTVILTAKMIAQKTAQLAIAVASKVAAAAQAVWNAIMNANPMVLIITLIIGAIVLLVMNWETVQKVAVKVWDAIKTAALWFWDNVLKPIGEWLAVQLVQRWQAMRDAVTAVWTWITDKVNKFWAGIKLFATWLAVQLVQRWRAMRDAVTAVWTWITDKVNKFWAGIKLFATWLAVQLVQRWRAMRDAVTAVWTWITGRVQAAWQYVMNFAAWLVGSLVQRWRAMRDAVGNVWSWINSTISNFWAYIMRVANYISGSFANVWTTVRNYATSAMNQVISWLSGVLNWVSSLVSWIGNALAGAWLTMRNYGLNALNSLIWPIQNVVNWLRNAWNWVQSLFSSGISRVAGWFGFSARVEHTGAPATAALGPTPGSSRWGGSSSTVTNYITIELPNYVGDRRELQRWLKEALKEIDRKNSRLVTA